MLVGRETRGIRIPEHTHTHTDGCTQMVSQLIEAVYPSVRKLINDYECLTGSWFNRSKLNNTVELFSHSVVAQSRTS